MAQYFQVVSQPKKPTMEELRQFYPNIVENQNIQYVLQPDEQQTQFQNQQILVLDNQPTQVIVNQTPVSTYPNQQFIVHQDVTADFQENGAQQQQVYYVEQVEAPTAVESKSVPPPQPVVLNHQITFQNQLSNNSQRLMTPLQRQLQVVQQNLVHHQQIRAITPQKQNQIGQVRGSTLSPGIRGSPGVRGIRPSGSPVARGSVSSGIRGSGSPGIRGLSPGMQGKSSQKVNSQQRVQGANTILNNQVAQAEEQMENIDKEAVTLSDGKIVMYKQTPGKKMEEVINKPKSKRNPSPRSQKGKAKATPKISTPSPLNNINNTPRPHSLIQQSQRNSLQSKSIGNQRLMGVEQQGVVSQQVIGFPHQQIGTQQMVGTPQTVQIIGSASQGILNPQVVGNSQTVCNPQEIINAQTVSNQTVINSQAVNNQVILNSQAASNQVILNTQTVGNQAVVGVVNQSPVNTQTVVNQTIINSPQLATTSQQIVGTPQQKLAQRGNQQQKSGTQQRAVTAQQRGIQVQRPTGQQRGVVTPQQRPMGIPQQRHGTPQTRSTTVLRQRTPRMQMRQQGVFVQPKIITPGTQQQAVQQGVEQQMIQQQESQQQGIQEQGAHQQGIQQQEMQQQEIQQQGTPLQTGSQQVIKHPQTKQQVTRMQQVSPNVFPYITSSQIKEIIENTPDTEEYSDSIRMLILLANGEQRLITFTLPKEQCTIHEILEQVGVQFNNETKIECVEMHNFNGINYVVTVGMPNQLIQREQQTIQTVQDTSSQQPTRQQSDEQQTQSLPNLVEGSTVEKSSSPEPVKEMPKLIPGQLAVCMHCGYLSEDFNKCLRCKRKFPDDVKSIPSTLSAAGIKKAETLRAVQQIQEKKQINITLKNNSGVKLGSGVNVTLSQINTKKKSPRQKIMEQEPVVVTLSSDEDEPPPPKVTLNAAEELAKKLQNSSVTLSAVRKEPSLNDMLENKDDNESSTNEGINDPPHIEFHLFCRTIRIGSYKFVPKEKLFISNEGIVMKVPHPKDDKDIRTITVERNHIVKVLVNFSKMLPVIFYYVKPSVGESIREELGMEKEGDNYFDPLSREEQFKRITILPEYLSESVKNNFKQIYNKPYNIIDELTSKEANNLLIMTCPKELTKVVSNNYSEVKQLFIYPPGKGGIPINTEDYLCLGQDQFLNDVIIEFYLKYLTLQMPKEKQSKIHVFSTFFYKRLTTKPTKGSRRSQPTELDPNLTPAQKRHARVKNWTKNVNIFEKDFIIVPINESCHWFLAIICFPGLDGVYTFDGQKTQIEPKEKKTKKPQEIPATSNVTITHVKIEKNSVSCEEGEGSDKDEAEGDDSELDSEEEIDDEANAQNSETSPLKRQPIKQPCILIFDSLAGASRSRVVATLRDYLSCEYKAKLGVDKVFNKDVIKGACPKVPQQTNFTDCGLYLLQYVESFFTNPIKDYRIPINGLKDWFGEITATKKREDITNLIKDFMVEYNKDMSLIPFVQLPTADGKLITQSNEFEDEFEEEEEFEMSEEEEEEGMEFMEESMKEDFFDESIEDGEMEEEAEIPAEREISDGEIQSIKETDSTADIVSSETESPQKQSEESNFSTKQSPMLVQLRQPLNSESSRETMKYLKSKRIIRHRNTEGEVKKQKVSD